MATKASKSSTLRIKTTSNMNILRIVLISAVGLISVALVIKMIRKGRKVSSAGRVTEDENVEMAMLLNSAISPERSWIGGLFVGADKDMIFELAKQIKNFEDVSREYYILYEESLSHDLQDALGDNYPAFLRIIKGEVITDAKANLLAESLYKEISGLNWTSRNLDPFYELLGLPNNDFIKVVKIYNTKYKTSLIDDIENESGVSIFLGSYQLEKWRDLEKKIIAKARNLNL